MGVNENLNRNLDLENGVQLQADPLWKKNMHKFLTTYSSIEVMFFGVVGAVAIFYTPDDDVNKPAIQLIFLALFVQCIHLVTGFSIFNRYRKATMDPFDTWITWILLGAYFLCSGFSVILLMIIAVVPENWHKYLLMGGGGVSIGVLGWLAVYKIPMAPVPNLGNHPVQQINQP